MDDFLGFCIYDFVLLFGIETCCNHRNGNGSFQTFIFPYPHNDVGTIPRFILNVVANFADFVNGDFFGTGNDEQQNVFGSLDFVVVQQRRVQGFGNGVLCPACTYCCGTPHDCCTTVGQHCSRIAQIDVLRVVVGNDFGNAPSSRGKYFIGFRKTGLETQVSIYLTQLIIVDDNQRIDILTQVLHPDVGLIVSDFSFKLKRNGYNTHRKDFHFLSHTGNNGCSARSRTAAHSGSDENHFGIGSQHVADFLHTLHSRLLSNLWIGTRTKAFGKRYP